MPKKNINKNSYSLVSILFILFCVIFLFYYLLQLIPQSNINKNCSMSNFSINQINPYYTNNNDVLLDVYSNPSKNDSINVRTNQKPVYGVPINIQTQSVEADYRQIGIVSRLNNKEQIMPLIGKPLLTNRDKWNYYVLDENNIKLPLNINGKNSTNEYGIDSLNNNDIINVNGYPNNTTFNVNLYENTQHKYIPIF